MSHTTTAVAEGAPPRGAAPAAAAPMSHREVLETLSGLLLAMFVAILSSTVVSNALPTIVNELEGTESGYTWVVTSTLLATTISTPIWGKLADLMSKKVLVQIAIVIFAISSIVAGLSQNMTMLITTRVFQGLGAGGLTALSQVILASIVSPRERGRYSGYLGATFALGTVAGPLIGGAITEHISWRWCFYVGVPFAVAALIVLQKTLHLPVVTRKAHIDYLGAILLAGGVSSLLIWVSLAGHDFDWVSWQTAAMVGGGIVLIGLTVLAEQIAPEPMIPLRLFRSRVTVLSSIASLFVGIGMFGGTVFLGQYFQLARGETPTWAGVMTIPMILGLFVSSTVSGRLISKTGKWKAWLVSGGVLLTAGLGLLGTISWDTEYWVVAPWMLLVGLGLGMMMQNLVVAVQNEVAVADLGAASSFVAFARSMGGAIGVSALGAVLGHRVEDHLVENFTNAGVRPSALGDGGRIPDISALPEPVRSIVQNSYGQGLAEVFLYAAAPAAVALLVTLFIRETTLRTSLADVPADAAGDAAAARRRADAPAGPECDAAAAARESDAPADARTTPLRLAAQDGSAPSGDSRERIGTPSGEPAAGPASNAAHTVHTPDAANVADVADAPASCRTISGLVRQAGDRPVDGAHVTLADQSGRQTARTTTGADGRYRLEVPTGGTYLLIVAARDVAPTANLVAVGDAPLSHDVVLAGRSAIAGRVLRSDVGGDLGAGQPLPVGGALVTLTDVTGQVVGHTRSTADGTYSFDGLGAGGYVLTAQSGRHRPLARSIDVAESGAVACDLVLSGGGRLRGEVVSASGRLVPEASLTLVDSSGQVAATTVSDDAGRYAFDDVDPGRYTLTASGYAPVACEVAVDEAQIDERRIVLGSSLDAASPAVRVR